MKKLLSSIAVIALMIGSFVSLPVFTSAPAYAGGACKCTAKNGAVTNGNYIDAAILSNVCECGHGEGVWHIINLVVDIMSVGVGILAVAGIGISGIQYLTAGGNEEKTRKAKRRIFEIVLGLAVYVVSYALFKFLGVSS